MLSDTNLRPTVAGHETIAPFCHAVYLHIRTPATTHPVSSLQSLQSLSPHPQPHKCCISSSIYDFFLFSSRVTNDPGPGLLLKLNLKFPFGLTLHYNFSWSFSSSVALWRTESKRRRRQGRAIEPSVQLAAEAATSGVVPDKSQLASHCYPVTAQRRNCKHGNTAKGSKL